MRWLLVFAAAAALVVSGCDDSSATSASSSAAESTEAAPAPSPQPQPAAAKPTKPSRTYTKAELVRLALRAQDAPADLGYLKGESGEKTLEEIGFTLPRQVKEIRSYGFKAVRDSVFAAKSSQATRRVAERVWLMKNASSASRWLARSKADSTLLGFTDLPATGFGDESWSLNGQAAGGVVVTHAFRLGNAVFVVTSYSAREPLSPAAARAAAAAALARAHNV